MITVFSDFDGVLFDSVKEAYLLARFAYYDIPVKDIIDDKLFLQFKNFRFLVTNSWQFFYIFKMFDSNLLINESVFQTLISHRDFIADANFDRKFQLMRLDLMNNDFDFWNSLESPFPFFYEIKSLSDAINLIIVSTKNETAVIKHCHDYGLFIPKEKVIGKSLLNNTYGSKRDFLKSYISKNKIENAIFIDDSTKIISECSDIPGLNVYQADWGYSNPDVKGYSQSEILQIIKGVLL